MNWIPDWILKIFGRKIADKIGLQEGTLDNTKPWYTSKTVISTIVTGIIGVYLSLITSGVHLPVIPAWVITVLSAVGIYGRVTADAKIG